MKRGIFFLLRLCVVALLFAALFYPRLLGIPEEVFKGVTFKELGDVISSLDAGTALFWIAFAVVMRIGGICCGVLRWRLLLLGQGIRLPVLYLARCWFMGRAIGLFLPGTIGLDGYRLVESATYTGQPIKCATVVAVEKLIGFIALFLLVFLTLPLGARMFSFNPAMLGVVLLILGSFISTAFLLLLNPRIAQVLVAALPVPGRIRHQVNTLGAAVTAYSGQRTLLMGAVVLGLGVHLAICMIYFGSAMAISGGAANVLDVLFASPLTIVGTVIAPTVGGVGVREAVQTALLGAKYGAEQAFLFGNLNYWIGEALPFLVSIPLLIFWGRPNRDKLVADIAAVRKETGGRGEGVHLSPEVIADYRNKLTSAIGAGLFGGILGAAAIGLAESIVHMRNLGAITDSIAYWWGPLVYGIAFSPVGLGIAAGLVFLYLLFDKFPPAKTTFALCLAGTVGALGLMIGLFRYRRDVLHEAAMQGGDFAKVFGGVAAVVAIAFVAGFFLSRVVRGGRILHAAAGTAGYLALVIAGVALAAADRPAVATPAFQAKGLSAPNIVLIVVDTLRADFLQAYKQDALPKTPNVSALAADSVVFQNTFAQSSWTKASFGTIFSGMYPEAHQATSKVSALPEDVVTFAEVLRDGGYYTRGFSNNPNITSIFNYNQGFIDYTDLKPNLYFGAKGSCEKLVGYDILRKVVQMFNAKILRGRMVITDFYQPAGPVTDIGLGWLDSAARPKDAPFFLFLHYMDPHDPNPDPDRPGKGFARVQTPNPDPEKWLQPMIKAYAAEIEYMDGHIGRLIDGLKQRGLYDNALIVFTADHGEEFQEHHGWWHGLSLYDEQIKIPLMLKLPGNQARGTYVSDLARHVDIAPTVAKFAGLAPPEKWQGQPLLKDDLASNNGTVGFVHSHLDFEGIQLKSLRSRDVKLITANEGNKRHYAPEELYDLRSDPGEQTNLAGAADRAAELALFKNNLTKTDKSIEAGAVPKAEFSTDDLPPELKELLESIGYGKAEK